MESSPKVLDVKTALTLPIDSLLIVGWFQDGARVAAAQIVAKKANSLFVTVWKSIAVGYGGPAELWTLKAEGGFLIDTRTLFRCTLQIPSAKERASITGIARKVPAPTLPLEGQHVEIQYDIDPVLAELPDVVGIVTAQLFDEMAVEISYFSTKQMKVIRESINLDRTSDGWCDSDFSVNCSVSAIDRAHYDTWLAEDEKAQRAIGRPIVSASAVKQQHANRTPVARKSAGRKTVVLPKS